MPNTILTFLTGYHGFTLIVLFCAVMGTEVHLQNST